jgi:hypothetical protein
MPHNVPGSAQSTFSSAVHAGPGAGQVRHWRRLEFDAQEYCHFLADCDWTEEQKREFIEALWQIVVSFVDLGFDLHPVQRVMNDARTLDVDSTDVLDSGHKLEILTTTDAGPNQLVGAERPDS